MRVLMVTGSFPPMKDGVAEYTATLVEALAGQPDTTIAVLTDRNALVDQRSAAYQTFAVMEAWTRDEFARVNSVLHEFRPDLIHIQYPTLGYRNWLPWLLPVYFRRLRIPVVQTWHEWKVARGWKRLLMTLGRGGIIVVRPRYVQHLKWWHRALLLHRQFEFIPNASTIPRAVFAPGEREALRASLGPLDQELVVFFGFIYRHKGIDDLIEAMDFSRQHLVLVGPHVTDDDYQQELFERIEREPLAGHVTVAGFLPTEKVAQVLAVADAVALPYRFGGGMWNTSLHAAMMQGTFTLTTSNEERGYDGGRNVYFSQPGKVPELREALRKYIGQRNPNPDPALLPPTWDAVARRHLEFYRRYLPPEVGRSRPANAERASYSAR